MIATSYLFQKINSIQTCKTSTTVIFTQFEQDCSEPITLYYTTKLLCIHHFNIHACLPFDMRDVTAGEKLFFILKETVVIFMRNQMFLLLSDLNYNKYVYKIFTWVTVLV